MTTPALFCSLFAILFLVSPADVQGRSTSTSPVDRQSTSAASSDAPEAVRQTPKELDIVEEVESDHDDDEEDSVENDDSKEDDIHHSVVKRSADGATTTQVVPLFSYLKGVLSSVADLVKMALLSAVQLVKSLVSSLAHWMLQLAKDRLLPAFLPFFSTVTEHPWVKTAVERSSTADWRPAATLLFDTLKMFIK